MMRRHRCILPAMVNEVRRYIENRLASGVIMNSKFPWASPVVLARKKNGKLRMCIKYRAPNNGTIKDYYAIPRTEDILFDSTWFFTFDTKSWYHQIEIEKKHKERTAFTLGSLGFNEFNKTRFGLCNSPTTYQ